MNIFTTSECPKQSALWLDDKRVNKMVLESAQLLCAAVTLHGGTSPYKLTHVNHPSSIWARRNKSNFIWLVEHAYALADTYKLVFKRNHACIPVIDTCYKQASLLSDEPLTTFANATPYKNSNNSIINIYRQYMCDKWEADPFVPTWRNRERPDWYVPMEYE